MVAPGDERDMALLGVIGEAMQCLEDVAVLATSWDAPWEGLAYYLRATEWTPFKTNNFWQESFRWNDDRLDVLAGLSAREPGTGAIQPLDAVLALEGVRYEHAAQQAMDAARLATRERLHRVLGILAGDWKQFSPYFLAYKHGGLTIGRADLAAVEDDVERITDATPVRDLAIAVWRKSSKTGEIAADELNDPSDIARMAAGSGRLALSLIDAFLGSRQWTIDALQFDVDGQVAGLLPIQIPWTAWLRERDLDHAHWQVLGAGPRISWVDENEDRRPAPTDGDGTLVQ